jgi:hypothetical protein
MKTRKAQDFNLTAQEQDWEDKIKATAAVMNMNSEISKGGQTPTCAHENEPNARWRDATPCGAVID